MNEKLLMVAERRAYHLFVYFMLTKINEVLFQVKADSLSEAAGLQVGSSNRIFCNFFRSIVFFFFLWFDYLFLFSLVNQYSFSTGWRPSDCS